MLKSEFEKAIYDIYRNIPHAETFKIEYKDKIRWIKIARKTGSNILHKLIYLATKNPLLIPVRKKPKHQAMMHEIIKLKKLKKMGIKVPKVVGYNEDLFVLKDRGESLYHLLRNSSFEDQRRLLFLTIEALSEFHSQGLYHGASQIKNFTYLDDKIYFIDFEESFSDDIDIKDIQFRDLFLFLLSIAKAGITVDLRSLVEVYTKQSSNEDFIPKLKELSKSLSWLSHLIGSKYIFKIADKDTKSLYKLLNILKDL